MRSASDKRLHRRYKVLKDAKVIRSNQRGLVDVIIKDLSVSGARIQLKSSTDLAGEFHLWVPAEKMLYPVVAKWQKEDCVGLQYTGEPEFVDLKNILN